MAFEVSAAVPRRSVLYVLSALLMLAGLVIAAPPAAAAVIQVETTSDSIAADGDCSLREAVIAANENAPQTGCPAGDPGHDTIRIPAGTYELTIPGTEENQSNTGDLDVTESVTFTGLGDEAGDVVIDAGGSGQSEQGCVFALPVGSPAGKPTSGIDRVLHILSPVSKSSAPAGFGEMTVDLNLVTVRGGTVEDDNFPAGGGILNVTADLTLTDSIVEDNVLAEDEPQQGLGSPSGILGGGIAGAGIASLFDGRLELNDSIVRQNIGFSSGSAVGGGITNQALFLNGSDPVASWDELAERIETREDSEAAPAGAEVPSIDMDDSVVRDNVLCSFVLGGGGGLSGRELVNIENSRFLDNVVVSGVALGGGADVGGGFSDGPGNGFTNVRTSLFRDNHALSIALDDEAPLGSFGGVGGGMASTAASDVRTSTFESNTTEFVPFFGPPADDVLLLGGGSAHSGGFSDLSRNTYSDNAANPETIDETASEAISVEEDLPTPAGTPPPSGTIEGLGGGLYSQSNGLAVNSTFSGNSADKGGGIAHEAPPEPPPSPEGSPSGDDTTFLDLEHATVTDNLAPTGGGLFVNGEGAGAIVSYYASIIAIQDEGPDCEQQGKGDFLDSEGANIDSDDTCDLDEPLDQENTDPELGELDDNGGPTLTHLPESTSPAVDWIGQKSCGPEIDQRGVGRPQDGDDDGDALCDVGAVELQGEPEFCPGFAGDPRPQIVGTDEPDVLEGTAQDEIICGLGKDDDLQGRGGADLVIGNNGDDSIGGGPGNDVLRGSGGEDEMVGDNGKDRIRGFTGDDELDGLDGDDDIGGGRGVDDIEGGFGDDLLVGWGGEDKVYGQEGDDNVQGTGDGDRLFGGSGKDLVKGNIGDDDLFGHAGRDKLVGFRGDDDLDGGPDPDECYGGPGTNTLTSC